MSKTRPVLPGRCYWVIPERFLAGNFPYNPGIDNPYEFLHSLLDNEINAFIDLTEEDELVHYQPVLAKITDKDVVYLRFAIVDYDVPDMSEMQQLVKKIDQLLQDGRNIYLHCRGGIGRTGTVVGCWLRSQGYNGDDALNELAKLFSVSNASRFVCSPETKEQRDFVKNYVSAVNKPSATE